MVGKGSRERFIQPGVGLIDLKVARIVAQRFGLELGLVLMIPAEKARSIAFGQIELAGDLVLADGPWGSLIFGVGGGADFGRYWWDHRGYPLVIVRERTWLSRKVKLEFESRTLPIAATGKLPLFEQRFEMVVGVGLFSFGMRFNWTASWGGQPERTYEQHELGAFVGLGL